MIERLIRLRSKLDAFYFGAGIVSGEMLGSYERDMDEPVRCTYIDLDRLIERCGLNAREQATVAMLMTGYTMDDIAETFECDVRGVRHTLRHASIKIANENDRQWQRTYTSRFGQVALPNESAENRSVV